MAAPLLVRSRWLSPVGFRMSAGRSGITAGGLALPSDLAEADSAGASGKVQGVGRRGVGAQRDRAVDRGELHEHVAAAADGLGCRGIGVARGAAGEGRGGRLRGTAEGIDHHSGGSLQIAAGDVYSGHVCAPGQCIAGSGHLLDEICSRRETGEAVGARGVGRSGADQGIVAAGGSAVEVAVAAVVEEFNRDAGKAGVVGRQPVSRQVVERHAGNRGGHTHRQQVAVFQGSNRRDRRTPRFRPEAFRPLPPRKPVTDSNHDHVEWGDE